MNFQENLARTVQSIPGALALSLIGMDGIRIESVVHTDAIDMDNLSAELTTFIRNLTMANADLRLGKLQQMALLSQAYTSIVSSVTDEYYLLCVLERQEYFGKARYELKKLALRLGEEF
jgi:predicted regulator of Ras-like GTPase activity (Roadblock/LC7/MglB family)